MADEKVFINLSVTDLERSTAFYSALGWNVNPLFSNENGACIVISEHIYAMLLLPSFFSTFTSKKIIDARTHVQGLFAVSCEDREKVDELMSEGLAAGGAEAAPAQEHGFMYARDLEDPDGHVWELFWMDPAAAQSGPPEA